jgi:hypothetical protein
MAFCGVMPGAFRKECLAVLFRMWIFLREIAGEHFLEMGPAFVTIHLQFKIIAPVALIGMHQKDEWHSVNIA